MRILNKPIFCASMMIFNSFFMPFSVGMIGSILSTILSEGKSFHSNLSSLCLVVGILCS